VAKNLMQKSQLKKSPAEKKAKLIGKIASEKIKKDK